MKGSDDLLIYRAKCCSPIMGEPIVGYITRGKGVSVHAQSCTNVVNLFYDPERRIAVEWDRGGEAAYEVRIGVGGGGPAWRAGRHHGAAGRHEHRHPRRRRCAPSTTSTAAIDLTLRIQDLKHLEKVVKSIRGLAGVIDVERQAVAADSRPRACSHTGRVARLIGHPATEPTRRTLCRRSTSRRPHAPTPIGPYSQGVIAGGLLFVSGQIPIDPATNQPDRGRHRGADRAGARRT